MGSASDETENEDVRPTSSAGVERGTMPGADTSAAGTSGTYNKRSRCKAL